MEQQSPKIG